MNDRLRTVAWLVPIIVLAACLRLYRLEELPPGLHYDEAFNATMAQRVVAGVERPIFFTEDLTEEPMAIYITALSFALFGASPWSLRLVSACAGILTIVVLYFLARALFRSKLIALLSAFILAILYWHISFSRLGMEPIFVPLTLTLAMGLLWGALSEKTLWLWGLGGFFLASTQYTYKAALFVPVLVALFLCVEFLVDRELLTRNWRGWLIFALVAFLVFAPLGLYFATHPNQFLERPSTVTANTGLATIAENSLRVAGMFFIQGDANPRSNLPNRPALDPFLAIGFVLGIVMCIARWRKRESRFLLLWLGVMVLPSILTDFAPHYGRSIGVTPAIALITASGFTTIIDRARADRQLRIAMLLLLFVGLTFSTYNTLSDYFNNWASRTGNFISFDVGYLTLARKLRARPAQTLYLSPVEREHYTIQFGLAGRKASSFDGRRVVVLSDTPAVYGIVTAEDYRLLARLQEFFPRGQVVDAIYDWTGKPYASIFQTTVAPVIAPAKSVNARFGEAIRLIGYDATRTANEIVLTIYWWSVAATPDDYTVFVQLIGAANPATQSPVWAQVDRRPGEGSYPTQHWQSGEIIGDDYRLQIPANAQGEFEIHVGLYNLKTGARLKVIDAPREQDYVILERLALP